MSDNTENGSESVMDKIADSVGTPSSSDAPVPEIKQSSPVPAASSQPRAFRLFGRERPVHDVLGGGKPADLLLWRDKKISGVVLGTATVIWILFELVEYHLLTLVCHVLILSLALLFLWSNAHTFINKSRPHVPEIILPEEPFLMVASQMTSEINRGIRLVREIASGKELKKFLAVIAGFWILSKVGNWCNFLTLAYIIFVMMYTIPVLYEKYDDKIDPLAERATIEIKKQFYVFDEKVLSKIPKIKRA